MVVGSNPTGPTFFLTFQTINHLIGDNPTMRNLDYADAGVMLVLVSHFVAYFSMVTS